MLKSCLFCYIQGRIQDCSREKAVSKYLVYFFTIILVPGFLWGGGWSFGLCFSKYFNFISAKVINNFYTLPSAIVLIFCFNLFIFIILWIKRVASHPNQGSHWTRPWYLLPISFSPLDTYKILRVISARISGKMAAFLLIGSRKINRRFLVNEYGDLSICSLYLSLGAKGKCVLLGENSLGISSFI